MNWLVHLFWLTSGEGDKKRPDFAKTVAFYSWVVVAAKVLVGGVTVAVAGAGSVAFTAIDAATATGVLASTLGLYWGRKHTDKMAAAKDAPKEGAK